MNPIDKLLEFHLHYFTLALCQWPQYSGIIKSNKVVHGTIIPCSRIMFNELNEKLR